MSAVNSMGSAGQAESRTLACTVQHCARDRECRVQTAISSTCMKQQSEAKKAQCSGSATAQAPLTGELRMPYRYGFCQHCMAHAC